MKERPILFSGSMVRALLAGTKTQTRRAIKRQPEPPRAIYTSHGADTKITPSLVRCEKGMGVAWRFEMSKVASDKHSTLAVGYIDHEPVRTVCPYGNPGDRLWVKETTLNVEDHGYCGPVYAESDEGRACLDAGLAPDPDDVTEVEPWEIKRRPSIYMPRAMSRILLEITDVRVERLQDISEADAVAEGCTVECMTPTGNDAGSAIHNPGGFLALWESINGAGAWDANPWVWAVSFKRVTP